MGITPQVASKLEKIMKKKSVGELLKDAGKLFEQRDKEYGNGYERMGKIMSSFFPDGLELKTKGDFDRYATFSMCMVKLNRYAENIGNGKVGHLDSARDLTVYASMLEWKTGE